MRFQIFSLLYFINVIKVEGNNYTAPPKDMELELVQVIFRHGERTSTLQEYEVLPYLNKSVYEPYGLGQMTNTGKVQMYNVGYMLKERYNKFLNRKYNPEEVYAYSSDDDRTKMSLQLVLAGLFPPSPGFVWNPELNWIPLPYRYTPKEVDILMKPYSSMKYIMLSNQVLKQPEYLKAISKYSHIFDLLRNKTGRNDSIYENPSALIGVYNLLLIHDRLGLPLPKWYTKQIEIDIRSSTAIIFRFYVYTLTQKRMNGGTMIKTFMHNMNLNGSFTNPRKIYLYSGHDITIHGLLSAYGIHKFDLIDFGTTLIVEKFKNSKDKVYVRLLAYTPIDKKLIALRFGNCEEFCPLKNYTKHIINVIPNDDEMNILLNEFNVSKLKELFFTDENVKLRL